MHVFRLYGRSGQGVDVARKILGRAAFLSGFYVQDFIFPSMGTQRVACVKLDKNVILSRDVPEPDFVLGFEPSADAARGAKDGAVAIFNSQKPVKKKTKCYYLPATDIALARKVAYPNTAMLGAVCKLFTKLSMRNVRNAMEIELNEMNVENAALVEDGFRAVKRC